MIRIGIILASTRTNRNGEQVAQWVRDNASRRVDAAFELVDLRDYPLPSPMDEPPRARPAGGSQDPQIRRWADTIASFDGFVIVTAEYNHSIPGVLKTALDYLYDEWNDKAVGFVSYGIVGGARAVQHLRAICGALQMADVAQQVTLSLQVDFGPAGFSPGDHQAVMLDALLDQVVGWSTALAPRRDRSAAAA